MEDEGVIFEQRQRIGSEFVQQGIAQNQGRLWAPWGLLLAQDIGDVVGAEGAGARSFFDSASHGFGTILTDEFQQFYDLAGKRAIGIGHVTQISFEHGLGAEAVQKQKQPLLCPRSSGSRA